MSERQLPPAPRANLRKLEPNAASSRALLLRVLRDAKELQGLSLKDWDSLIPQARFAGLWPQVASSARRGGCLVEVPAAVRRQIDAMLIVADAAAARDRWEINRLAQAFADAACPLILLKGAAYLCAEFVWAEGRSFQDIDVLVPREKLAHVESALRRRGWINSVESPLDARYFAQWLQEIAPLWHPDRRIQVDIHHTIIPPRDRLRFDPAPLFADAVSRAGAIHTLCPVDMVLHSSANLFWTGEFTFILRDLHDLHSMLGEFSQLSGFWSQLTARAEQLNLTLAFYYAHRYLRLVFQTPVPDEISAAIERWRPNSLRLKIVDQLVQRTLFPHSLDEIDWTRNLALTWREYWATPRLGVLCTSLFWLKRLPGWMQVWLRLKPPDADLPAPRVHFPP